MIRWLNITLISITGISIWIILSNNHVSQLSTSGEILDGFMTQAYYTQYDARTGKIHTQIYSPKMTHYNRNNTSYFSQPHLLLYANNNSNWQVSAKYGKATYDGEKVEVWDQVEIHQPTYLNRPEIRIITDGASIYPHLYYAKTQLPVVITRANASVQGRGMQANFKTGIFKLLSQVKGIYEPVPKNNY